jgi:hypothetical protein
MHFARTRTDAQWVNGLSIDASVLRDLDQKLFQSISGDGGGTWAPTSPIEIGGQGLIASGPCVVTGANGRIMTWAGSRFVLGDNDFPILLPGHASSTRTLVNSCILAFADHEVRISGANVQTTVTGSRLVIPFSRVHHGATLTQAVFNFAVGTAHSNVPARLPQFRVVRVDAQGNISPLHVSASAPDGYLSPPTPQSGADWYAQGLPQPFTYVCDRNNVIDVGSFTYAAQIIEESGVNSLAGTMYATIALTFQNILDMRFA